MCIALEVSKMVMLVSSLVQRGVSIERVHAVEDYFNVYLMDEVD